MSDSVTTWNESEFYKFTKDHYGFEVESWGKYSGKNSGYIPLGYIIEYDKKRMFYDLNGRFVKSEDL